MELMASNNKPFNLSDSKGATALQTPTSIGISQKPSHLLISLHNVEHFTNFKAWATPKPSIN